MSSWFRHWRMRVPSKLFWPFSHMPGRHIRNIGIRYEKAGLAVPDEPIPWNAEAVIVDVTVWLPPNESKRKSDFLLRLPGRPPALALSLRAGDQEGIFHLVFRLPPLDGTATGAITFQNILLGQVVLPFLSAPEFLSHLQFQAPALVASLGECHVAGQVFVDGQCRSLTASGLLTSPTSLLPLLDFGVAIEYEDPSNHSVRRAAVQLTSAQLRSRQAIVSAALPRWPLLTDSFALRWLLKERPLAILRARRISVEVFRDSLYLVESGFLYQDGHNSTVTLHHLPPPGECTGRLQPYFLIASREPGMAALCPLELRIQYRDAARPPVLCRQQVLVTDGPSLFHPTSVNMENLHDIRSFDLSCEGRHLGLLPISFTPAASFTSEGGFRSSQDYEWTAATEEELVSRLLRLMDTDVDEKSRKTSARA